MFIILRSKVCPLFPFFLLKIQKPAHGHWRDPMFLVHLPGIIVFQQELAPYPN